jgi:hypothetical protein
MELTATLATAGLTVSGVAVVVAEITFEMSDQLPASSPALIANQYAVEGWRPDTVKLSLVPGAPGAGTPVARVAFTKFAAVMVAVE